MCAAATERTGAVGGRGVAARADKQLRAVLTKQCSLSYDLLRSGLKQQHGLDPAQYAPLLDLVRAPGSPRRRCARRRASMSRFWPR